MRGIIDRFEGGFAVVETENGITFVNESAKRSAPYFNMIIDGITAVTE